MSPTFLKIYYKAFYSIVVQFVFQVLEYLKERKINVSQYSFFHFIFQNDLFPFAYLYLNMREIFDAGS